MSFDQCLADWVAASQVCSGPQRPRPVLARTVPQLAGAREFGALIRRQLVHCTQAGVRPAVLLVAVNGSADPVDRLDQLATVATRLRCRVRGSDTVVQFGERFGLFLQGDVGRHVLSIRERLRRALQDDILTGSTSVRLRPRFGLAIHPGIPVSGMELIAEAERTLEP